jgi:hypothetical protein
VVAATILAADAVLPRAGHRSRCAIPIIVLLTLFAVAVSLVRVPFGAHRDVGGRAGDPSAVIFATPSHCR